MDLWCVKNEEQIRQIGSELTAGKHHHLLPLMPKAALSLMDLGAPDLRLPIDFLSRGENQAIHQQAIELSKTWDRQWRRQVRYQGIDLLDCCRLQMLGFFQDVIAGEMIAPRLLAEYKPKRAVFFEPPSVPSFGHPMHDGTAHVLEAVLQWRFRQAGVEVTVREERAVPPSGSKDKEGGLTGSIRRIRSFLEAKLRQGRNLLPRPTPSPDLPPANPNRLTFRDVASRQPLLTGYGGSYDLLVIWPYIKAIAAQIKGTPVLLNTSPHFDAQTTRSGLSAHEDLRYVFVGDLPVAPNEGPDLGAARAACLRSLAGGEPLPAILQNPLLSFQFVLLWDRLVVEALAAARRATAFFAQCRTALYLDDYCAGPANRAWTEAANLAGVPTVNVPHGSLNLVEFHDFNSKWAFAWGELGRQNWDLASPEKQDGVIIAGDPSMENLRDECSAPAETPGRAVLLMTGGFLHQAWTDMDLKGFLGTWEDLAQIARDRPHLEFVVKPHPSVRDLGYWYRAFFEKKALPNVKVVDHQRLEDLLPSAFFAVLVGKPGTAGLVSALARVPFVYLDTMLCREVPGYRIWCDANGSPRLTGCPQLGPLIDRVFAHPEDREALLKQNQRFSELYLTSFDPVPVCRKMGLLD